MAGYEEAFARYYDSLTADVDYRAKGEYLKKLAEKHGGRFRLVLDLACGTGSLAVSLARQGVEVIAVDGSQEMLAQAMSKSAGLVPPILYLCQEMTGWTCTERWIPPFVPWTASTTCRGRKPLGRCSTGSGSSPNQAVCSSLI